ncbi:MAG: hypothetical protein R3F10_01125 [Lysobacteraceae bacterium]
MTEDIDRQSRTAADIGADEASASGGTPPSPPTSTFQIDGRVSGAQGVNPAPTGQGAFFEVIGQAHTGLYGSWFGASANPASRRCASSLGYARRHHPGRYRAVAVLLKLA